MTDPMRTLHRGYELLWRENRVEDALSGLPADFEWVAPDMPEGDVRRGPDGAIAFFREWMESFDDVHVDWTLHQAGPEQVLAAIEMRGRGRGSGAPFELHFGQLWTFREGRARRMVIYNDLEAARRDAAL